VKQGSLEEENEKREKVKVRKKKDVKQ